MMQLVTYKCIKCNGEVTLQPPELENDCCVECGATQSMTELAGTIGVKSYKCRKCGERYFAVYPVDGGVHIMFELEHWDKSLVRFDLGCTKEDTKSYFTGKLKTYRKEGDQEEEIK